jgi:hypothetical protein
MSDTPTTPTPADRQEAAGAWTIVAPDGKTFAGESPFKAAREANKHHLTIDPVAAARFAAAIEEARKEGEAEREQCMRDYGTLDCPACGGSGHIADTKARAAGEDGALPELPEPGWLTTAYGYTADQMRAYAIQALLKAVSVHQDAALAARAQPAATPPDAGVREALAELVALKDMKERLERLHEMGMGTDYTDYHRRKPLAWAAARTALAAQPIPPAEVEVAQGAPKRGFAARLASKEGGQQ